MKYLSLSAIVFSICTILFCCSTQTVNETNKEIDVDKPSQIEETDDFVKLVDQYLGDLYRVEKKTTGEGYNERGKGTLAMYFQGDYVIKKEENIEIDNVFYEEETYLYNLNPIYHVQKITYPNGKVENNQIYLQERKITHWYRDGQLITDPAQIKIKDTELTTNYDRFR